MCKYSTGAMLHPATKFKYCSDKTKYNKTYNLLVRGLKCMRNISVIVVTFPWFHSQYEKNQASDKRQMISLLDMHNFFVKTILLFKLEPLYSLKI